MMSCVKEDTIGMAAKATPMLRRPPGSRRDYRVYVHAGVNKCAQASGCSIDRTNGRRGHRKEPARPAAPLADSRGAMSTGVRPTWAASAGSIGPIVFTAHPKTRKAA
jgi:hypothetical protein